MKRIALVLALICLPILAGATHYPLKIKDCRGKSITIRHEPGRIVSIAPSNTEVLYALGAESKVVGVTKYCDYPPAAKKKPKVGDRVISTERVLLLKPDLILAHGFLNADAIRNLESYGLTVVAIDPKTIEQVGSDIKMIGRVVNREKQAAAVVGRITSTEALVQRKTAGFRPKPRVLVTVQADPVWAAGPKTFVDEMIRLAGGTNVAADAKPGFNQFSAEIAVARNPDIIIGTAKGDKKVFVKGFWKSTNAARRGSIYEADPDLLVRPGPRLADGILAVAKMIHPEVFK